MSDLFGNHIVGFSTWWLITFFYSKNLVTIYIIIIYIIQEKVLINKYWFYTITNSDFYRPKISSKRVGLLNDTYNFIICFKVHL